MTSSLQNVVAFPGIDLSKVLKQKPSRRSRPVMGLSLAKYSKMVIFAIDENGLPELWTDGLSDIEAAALAGVAHQALAERILHPERIFAGGEKTG